MWGTRLWLLLCFMLLVTVDMEPGEGDRRKLGCHGSCPMWMVSLGILAAVLWVQPLGTGGCAGRWHRAGVSKPSSPAYPAVQAQLWTGPCVLLPWSPALQRLREVQNPGCSAEHLLCFRRGRSRPESCSGSATQKSMVIQGKGMVPASRSPMSRSQWSPSTLLPGLEGSARALPPLLRIISILFLPH